MRRAGSVRLCNVVPGCRQRWPCKHHGTLTASGLLPVSVHEPVAERKDPTARPGWRSYKSGDVYERDDGRAAVWRSPKGNTWEVGPRAPGATSNSYDSAHDWGRKNFPFAAEAMAYADEMLEQEDAHRALVTARRLVC